MQNWPVIWMFAAINNVVWSIASSLNWSILIMKAQRVLSIQVKLNIVFYKSKNVLIWQNIQIWVSVFLSCGKHTVIPDSKSVINAILLFVPYWNYSNQTETWVSILRKQILQHNDKLNVMHVSFRSAYLSSRYTFNTEWYNLAIVIPKVSSILRIFIQ